MHAIKIQLRKIKEKRCCLIHSSVHFDNVLGMMQQRISATLAILLEVCKHTGKTADPTIKRMHICTLDLPYLAGGFSASGTMVMTSDTQEKQNLLSLPTH